MSYGVHSDEVAEDYGRALEELTLNSRYEISNLTVIARENTEHALAISQALKDHIKKTAPNKKLPAFYVLDSVVKNVGTPYTIFLARNLYSTFMEAYALVDGNVRRKMEEMLKTWKEPVPGSIDSRPVFPIDTTRPIETALIKYRTATLQAQHAQQQAMFQQRPGMAGMGMNGYRHTATPPNAMRPNQFGAPPEHLYQGQGHEQDYRQVGSQYGQQPSQYGGQYAQVGAHHDPRRGRVEPVGHETYPLAQYQRPGSAVPTWQQPSQPGMQTSGRLDVSLDTLKSDIARLIVMSRNDFTNNPHDTSKQIRLKALFDLQNVLDSQVLPQDQLAAVRMQVDQLSLSAPAQVMPTPTPQPSYAAAPAQPSLNLPMQIQAQPPTPSLGSLLAGGSAQSSIAALLAKAASATPQIQTPPQVFQQTVKVPSPRSSSVQPILTPDLTPALPVAAPANPLALLNKLRATGLLKATPVSTPPPVLPAAISTNLSTNVPPGFPPKLGFLNGAQALPEIPNDVELKAASLKTPRRYLIDALYSRLGQPCTQCGQRFQVDEEGKQKKIAHLDWHFSINNRIAAVATNGQPCKRSWYSDEMDWIQTRESADDHLLSHTDSPKLTEAALTAPRTSRPYVRIPDVVDNKHCSICQEAFTPMYQPDTDEYVWDDAIVEGNKYVHASCRAEIEKAQAVRAARQKSVEGESVLGKRKNEDEHTLRMKIKSEPV